MGAYMRGASIWKDKFLGGVYFRGLIWGWGLMVVHPINGFTVVHPINGIIG